MILTKYQTYDLDSRIQRTTIVLYVSELRGVIFSLFLVDHFAFKLGTWREMIFLIFFSNSLILLVYVYTSYRPTIGPM